MSAALQYLLSRNFTSETIIEWQIGVCAESRVIAPQAVNAGVFSILERFGLVKSKNTPTHGEGAGQSNVWDFFHHRITIPLHDVSGNLVGFAGRVFDNSNPNAQKYLNPSESPLYKKDKILFGLHKARRSFPKFGKAILVEGYFDVIRLHACGFTNAIATCGTALTKGQAKLLKRFTDTVVIARDGDKAGLKAISRDIPVLLAQQFRVEVCLLPDGEDPDSLFADTTKRRLFKKNHETIDGLMYLVNNLMLFANGATARAQAIEQIVELLALITNTVTREQYVREICKEYKKDLKAADLLRPLDKLFKLREEEKRAAEEEQDSDKLPQWVDKKFLFDYGFCQLGNHTKGYRAGIYSMAGSLQPVTNFTIKPLYHLLEQSNNRRLLEVCNGERTAIVEMPSQAFTTSSIFENELINKGHFITHHTFSRKDFKLIVAWLSNQMPIAYELKTLGWQPEGFFAFSNAVYLPPTAEQSGAMLEYDDLGMIKINDKYYMSLGNSKLHKDERETDNPYENDLYLKHVPAPMTFARWAELFCKAYTVHAPFGIAFVFLSLFKDIATRTGKMPMLYPFGPKGSGKSDFAESITWLFFSGKDAEGNLMRGYNLNPGQGTPFSFFNRVERFRNCPILMNEFDENNIEDWKFGTFKASYDGEGREVGDGTTGKKRKTIIQKVQGTIIAVGQYLSVKDDGSVLSRSISCQFSLERLSRLTQEEIDAHKELKEAERKGLSGILTELMQLRPEVVKRFATQYSSLHNRMMNETREAGHRVEVRLISNYTMVLTALRLVADLGITLPFSFDEFFDQCKARVISHNRMLKDNNSLNQFWKALEFLFDRGVIHYGKEFTVAVHKEIRLKDGSTTKLETFATTTELLLVRFDTVYGFYAKHMREISGQAALSAETLLLYLKDQSYYLGLTPNETFSDKRTSAYVFKYDAIKEMGIVLEKHEGGTPEPSPAPQLSSEPDWVKS